LLWSLLFYI